MRFRSVLSLVVATIDLPFGYTLSIWAAGAIAIGRYGFPSFGQVFAFILGGIAAYVGSALLAMTEVAPVPAPACFRSTLLNVCAILAAIAVSAIAQFVSTPAIGYFLAGGTATLVYIFALAILNWLVAG